MSDYSYEDSDMDIDVSYESDYYESDEEEGSGQDTMVMDSGSSTVSDNNEPGAPQIELRSPRYMLRTRRQSPEAALEPLEQVPPEGAVVDVPLCTVLPEPPLPTMDPPKENFDEDSFSEQCTICMDPLTNSGSHRIVALVCGHIYGRNCIEKWLKGDAKRCPQCNCKAKKSDIRNLCITSVRVLDTAERDRTLQELEKEQQLRRRAELESAQLRLKLDLANQEIAKLKNRQQSAGLSTKMSNWTACQLQCGSDAECPELNLALCKSIEVTKEDGACRVLACSEGIGMLVASVHSTTSFMPGYGVKKYYTADFQSQYMHIHSEPIRDLAFHPSRIDGLLLSASLDKSVKLTSVLTNHTVQSYSLDSPVWSCIWNHDNDYELFAGCVNGSTLVYDIRHTSAHVHKLTSDKKTPVTSLQYVKQDGANAFCGGIVVGHLNGCVLHETSSSGHYAPYIMPIDGSLSSLSFDSLSRLILVSMRPSESYPNARHIVCELMKHPTVDAAETKYNCNEVQIFRGGNTQKLLTRSRIFAHPAKQSSTLVCAGDELSSSANIWDVGTGKCVNKLPSKSTILDICPLNNEGSFVLATLAGKSITLYSNKTSR